MSLIGCPQVEFMDEPTTGVDPVSRRSLFKMLKRLDDSSLVLTTHRMDEAESLCDNIVIMINGRFVCYGSPGHLKEQYGQGYSITMKHVIQDHQILLQSMPYLQFESSTTTTEVDPETGL
jgi:ATP-binding cassette subfamily A (ABC1) protein 3